MCLPNEKLNGFARILSFERGFDSILLSFRLFEISLCTEFNRSFLFLAVCDSGGSGAGSAPVGSASRRFLTEFLQEQPAVGSSPYFDLSVPTNLTGLVGQPVRLLCRVRGLGNRTVSIFESFFLSRWFVDGFLY